MQDRVKISEILGKNALIPEKDDRPRQSLAKSVATGAGSGLIGAIGFIPTVAEGLTRSTIGGVSSLFDEDTSLKEGLLKGLTENKSLQATGWLDDKYRDLIGAKSYEDLSGEEQAGELVGELIPLIASGGTTGLVKLGNKGIKKAAKIATKHGVNTKKALKYSKIAQDLMLPGVQISKKAPLKQKLLEGSVQTALPLGINEAVRASSNQEGILGDYRKKEPLDVTLFTDKRAIRGKEYLDEIDPEKVKEYQIDRDAKESKTLSDILGTSALYASVLIGGSVAANKAKSLMKKEVQEVTNNLYENLSKSTKFNMNTNDRFAFTDDFIKQNIITEEEANKLYRDSNTIINNMVETGNFSPKIQTKVAPRETFTSLQELKTTDLPRYSKLERFIELNSQIQDETNRYNVYISKGKKNYSPDEYISDRTNNKIPDFVEDYNMTSKGAFNKKVEELTQLRKEIDKDPRLKELTNQISDISEKLFDYQVENGIFGAEGIANLRKNRTINNLFLYKHRVATREEKGFLDKISNWFLDKQIMNADEFGNTSVRGITPIVNAQNYLDVAEFSMKQAIKEVEDNNNRKMLLKAMNKKTIDDITTAVEDYDKAYNDVFKANPRNFDEVNNKISIRDTKKFELPNKIRQFFGNCRYLGRKKITNINQGFDKAQTFNELLNKSESEFLATDPNTKQSLNRTFKQQKAEVDEKNLKKAGVTSYIDGDYEYFYEIDPHFKAAMNLNSNIGSLLGKFSYAMKNFKQSMITGAFNPAFAIPSATMSIHENLLVLPTIIKSMSDQFPLMTNFSRVDYLKEVGKALKQSIADYKANAIIDNYAKNIMHEASVDPTAFAQNSVKVNVDKTRQDIRHSLLSEIKSQGGLSAKPLNMSNDRFFDLKSGTNLDNIMSKLGNVYGVQGTYKVLKLLNYFSTALREAPTIGLYSYLGKLGKISDGTRVLDKKGMQKLIKNINIYTANNSKRGTGVGLSGSVADFISKYISWGNIAIHSLAPKIKASGIQKGVENIADIFMAIGDNKTRGIDLLQKISNVAKQAKDNSFMQGVFYTTVIPSIISYVWNHGSTDNIEDYYRTSDYHKGSKFILTNFFGKGRHLTIPKDQESAILDDLVYIVLDNTLGMSKYNDIDPNFQQSRVLMESLGRSIGLDGIPMLDLLANTAGYEMNLLNPFSNRDIIAPLSKNVVNSDLSETAYSNGIANQQVTALINNIFGTLGSALLTSMEEFNVGKENSTGINDATASFVDKMFNSAKILQKDRNISAYNESSKYVYNINGLLQKIAPLDKTPQQEEVYNTIKMYRRNRIKPVHDLIKETRKEIQQIKSTGRLSDGSVVDYEGRKLNINTYNKKLQQLYAKEYDEYKNLDNLLEQLYGKGTTIQTFMKQ